MLTLPHEAAAAAPQKRRKRRHTTGALHEPTSALPTGAGAAASSAIGQRARASTALWDLSVPPPPCIAPSVALRCVPVSAAAAAQMEVARAKAMDGLRKTLHTLCVAAGLDAPPQLALERWRFACKLAEEVAEAKTGVAAKRKRRLAGPVDASDALLPCVALCGDGGGLAGDLERAGLSALSAAGVAEALHAASCAAQKQLAQMAQRVASAGLLVESRVVTVFHKRSVTQTHGPSFVTVTREAYGKLAVLHRAHGPPEERTPAPPAHISDDVDEDDREAAAAAAAGDVRAYAGFHARLFALLLRYKTLRGHGFQAAAGPGVFRVLHALLGVDFECFASPLNARYGRYCSAFADTDAPFGSAGSFFSMQEGPTRGAFEVNPPFTAACLDTAARRCLHLLAAAEAASQPLSFVVLMPGWKETWARSALLSSVNLTFNATIAAADHGFCDGASHARQDPFRASPYDTEIVVLQSARARALRPVDSALLDSRLRAAFAACCPSQAALKRQGRALEG